MGKRVDFITPSKQLDQTQHYYIHTVCGIEGSSQLVHCAHTCMCIHTAQSTPMYTHINLLTQTLLDCWKSINT